MEEKNLKKERPYRGSYKIAVSGLMIALYVVMMVLTQSFSFGAYQIRLATALYGFAYIHPFLVLPLAMANGISNFLLGGLGVFDVFGGCLVGLLCAGGCALLAKKRLSSWYCVPMIILIPGLGVATWLSYLLHIPYGAMALSLLIGQIFPAVLAGVLLKYLKDKI